MPPRSGYAVCATSAPPTNGNSQSTAQLQHPAAPRRIHPTATRSGRKHRPAETKRHHAMRPPALLMQQPPQLRRALGQQVITHRPASVSAQTPTGSHRPRWKPPAATASTPPITAGRQGTDAHRHNPAYLPTSASAYAILLQMTGPVAARPRTAL